MAGRVHQSPLCDELDWSPTNDRFLRALGPSLSSTVFCRQLHLHNTNMNIRDSIFNNKYNKYLVTKSQMTWKGQWCVLRKAGVRRGGDVQKRMSNVRSYRLFVFSFVVFGLHVVLYCIILTRAGESTMMITSKNRKKMFPIRQLVPPSRLPPR